MPALPPVILSRDRVVVAIGEEVLVPGGAAGRDGRHRRRVRIDEPAPGGIVVPCLQVVQPRLIVVYIASVSKRIQLAQRAGHAAGSGQQVAPGVVGVGDYLVAPAVHDAQHVPLGVAQEVVGGAVRYRRQTDGQGIAVLRAYIYST